MNKDNLHVTYVFTVVFCVFWHFVLLKADRP